MLSVLGWPTAYANYVIVRHEYNYAAPFNCFHLSNTNNTRKCSPQTQLQSGYNSTLRTFCKRNQHLTPFSQGFSALQDHSPWDTADIWTSLALYLFSLHIPFSFGGLSVVALFSGQPVLDPQTQALSLLTIQILELYSALVLLKYTAKPQYKFTSFFKNEKLSNDRNWLLASALGFGFLVLLIFLTSQLADRLFGSKPVKNPILKEILLNSDISRVSCVLAYCVVTPVLEEVVYRGFLLTSLSSTMEWQQAVALSSIIFSSIHFSAENFLQLFIIGCVLGCSYCWTGNLNSSIAIHSLYNALTLVISYFY